MTVIRSRPPLPDDRVTVSSRRPVVGMLGDVLQIYSAAFQCGQHQQQEIRAKGPSPNLISQRSPFDLHPGLAQAPRQVSEIDIQCAHALLQEGNDCPLPFLLSDFGKRSHHPLQAATTASYLMPFSVARLRAWLYNGINIDAVWRGEMEHFLKSAKARTLSVKRVMRMTEEEAFTEFRKLRWPDTDGEAVCPHCGYERCYFIRSRSIFKCAACRRQFSVTSGTIFSSAKLPLRDYLAVIALYVHNAKGISAIQVSRSMGISYKAAFVLLHKLREAIEDGRADMKVGGLVEMDAAYYGGSVRPLNTGRDGARPKGKRPKKKCVLTLVQRDGPAVTVLVESENTDDVLAAAAKHVLPGSTVYADEHGAYDALHARYETFRINHRWSYAEGHVSTNRAESFHSRMRRAEIGVYHRISGRYISRYAAEMAHRHDRRRVDSRAIFREVTEMALNHPVSREWKGYWQARA